MDATGYCQACAPECYYCVASDNQSCTDCWDNDNAYVEIVDQEAGSGYCTCDPGSYYGEGEGFSCNSCHWKCATCVDYSASSCLSCSDQNASVDSPDGSGNCLCNDGFYDSGEGCSRCDLQCATCLNGNYDTCLTCYGDGYIDSPGEGGEGVCVCDSSYFYGANNEGIYDCWVCDVTCANCVGFYDTDCTECLDNAKLSVNEGSSRRLQSGACYCVDGYYPDTDASDCQPCAPECKTCLNGDSASCFSCYGVDSYLDVAPGPCLCDSGFYYDVVTVFDCAPCFWQCATCVDGGQAGCLTCHDLNASVSASTPPPISAARGLLAAPSAGECVCNPAYYFDGEGCSSCDQQCLTCLNYSYNNCFTCYGTGYVVRPGESGEGLCGCNDGLYYGVDASNAWQCLPCYFTCVTCVWGGQYDCTSCLTNAEVLEDRRRLQIVGSCICSYGFYPDTDSTNCKACDPHCTQCNLGDANSCWGCYGSAYINEAPGPCVCDSGYFYDPYIKYECVKCDPDCVECTDETKLGCTVCSATAVLGGPPQGSCTCPSGYYPDYTTPPLACLLCDVSCFECNAAGPSACTACFKNASVVSSQCVCDPGFAMNPNAANCAPCLPSCVTCVSTDVNYCETCKANASLSAGVCNCNANYAWIAGTATCDSCPNLCVVCTSSSTCIVCQVNTQLTGGLCSCSVGFFLNSSTSTCDPCNNTCFTCNGAGSSQCISCKAYAAFLSPNPAICSCTPGFYQDIASGDCLVCDPSCKECIGAGSSKCSVCFSNASLTLGTCQCNPGTVNGSPPANCPLCHATCSQCFGVTLNSCLACKPHANLDVSNACVCVLPYFGEPDSSNCVLCDVSCKTCTVTGINGCSTCFAGYYLSASNSCLACPVQCASCTSPTNCVTCKDANALIPLCNCGTGFYPISGGLCKACDATCLTCVLGGATSCQSCFTNSILTSGVCTCPTAGFTGVPQNCQPCYLTCATCSGTANNQCVTCYSNASISIINSGQCECNSAFYPNPTAATCSACSNSCGNCNGPSASSCFTCPANAQLVSSSPAACQCSAGFYLASVFVCSSCPVQCTMCASPTLCTACKDANASGSLCVCNPGYFSISGGLCQICNPSCLTCTAATSSSCQSCFTNAVLTGSICVCPTAGFSGLPQNCQPCDLTCATCSGTAFNQCVTCKSSASISVVNPGQCECNSAFYPNPTSATCSACSISCGNCNGPSASSCLTCPANAQLVSSSPAACQCSAGFYLASVFVCTSCPVQCTQCTSSTLCTICKDANASGSLCACNPGYFPISGGLCQACDPSCLTCSAGTTSSCLSCFTNEILTGGVCVCPTIGFADSIASCQPCNPTCLTCTGPALNQCVTCKSSASISVINPGQCECNSAFYPNPTSATCSACSTSCGNCNGPSASSCFTCPANAQLVSSSPAACQCSAGFYLASVFVCSSCPVQCTMCASPTLCTACKDANASGSLCACNPGYFSISGGLCQICDASCLTCTAAASSSCQSCLTNAVLNIGVCVCPLAGFTGFPQNCQPCDPTCATCSGTAFNQCVACYSNASISVVNPGQCECNSAFYPNPTSATCSACSISCGNCNGPSASSCLTCPANAQLVSSSPAACQCSAGFYLASVFVCTSCPVQCTQCTSPTLCTICKDANASGSLCACNPGYFSISGGLCQACDPSCSTCSAGTSSSCLSCLVNAVLNIGVCVCPVAGFTGLPQNCQPCDSTCATCSGTAINQCVTCKSNASISVVNPDQCECNAAFYPNPTSATCSACSTSCGNCNGPSASSCLSCPADAQLASISPAACQCSPGFYLASVFVCTSCPVQCTQCTNPTLCTVCKDANASGSLCACNTGYFPISGGLCQACDSSCLTCLSAASSSCQSCFSNSILTLGICACPATGFFGPPENCAPCHTSCSVCSGAAISQCTACKSDAVLSAIHPGQCECAAGFWPSPSAANCVACPQSCATCSGGTPSSCLSCPANSNLSSSAPSSCDCLPGFTFYGSPPSCVLCSPECQTCVLGSPSACTSCKPGATLTLTTPASCGCTIGFYPSPNPGNCVTCPGLCASCGSVTPNFCLSCKANSETAGPGACVCSSGYALSSDGTGCQVCHFSCLTCKDNSASSCLTCPPKSGLASAAPSSCLCISSYFRDPLTSNCIPASQACTRCSATGLCRECADNAGIPFGSTACQCFSGFYPNLTAENCAACNEECAACVNATKTGCMKCKGNAELIGAAPSGCKCAVKFYPSPNAGKCSPCLAGCAVCENATNCQVCDPKYVLVGSVCRGCPDNCVSCGAPDVCSVCSTGWLLSFNGSCKQCSDCSLPFTASAMGPFSHQYNITFSHFVPKDFVSDDLLLTTLPNSSISWRIVENHNLTVEVSGGPWTTDTQILINFTTDVQDEFGNLLSTKQLTVPPPIDPPAPPAPDPTNTTILLNTTLATTTSTTSATIGSTLIVAGASSGGGSAAMALLSQMQYFSYIGTANYTMTGSMNSFYASLNQKSVMPNFFGRTRGLNAKDARRLTQIDGMALIDPDDFMDNCGQFLSIFVIIVGVHGIVFLLNRSLGKRYKLIQRLNSQFKWTVYLYFWYFAYLDLEVAALLQLKDHGISSSDTREILCTLFAAITAFFTSITPLFLFWFIRSRANLLFAISDNLTKSRFSVLVSSLRTDLSRAKYLYPVYYFQRLLYGFLIVFLRGMQLYQALALIVPCALMALFVLFARPMATKMMRILHMIAELDVVMVFVLLCFLTIQYNTPRIDICWLIVGFTLKSFICTVLIVLIGFVEMIKQKCRDRKRINAVHPSSNLTQVEDIKITTTQTEEKEISFSEAFSYVKRIPKSKVAVESEWDKDRASISKNSDLTEQTL